VSTSTALAEGESGGAAQPSTPKRTEPFRNPSYPQRVHFHEQAQLEETVRSWDAKIEELGSSLPQPGSNQDQEARHRIYHQMLGARDQLAQAARRMPLETAGLYDEDHELFRLAEAALGRLVQQWGQLS
jgi:hypothetical protein